MRVYIITIHCIHNFGSVFQSYGLVKYLQNEGYDAELIDYRPDYFRGGRNPLRKYSSIALNLISYTKQYKHYQSFIDKKIIKTSTVYHSIKELQKLAKEDAVFITGGDQLWNSFHPCGRDDAYKLTFVHKGKKIAYGTSMGRISYSKDELEELSKKISDYITIGLREQSTVSMLQQHTKVPVYHAADPVLLLNKENYMSFIGEKRLINEPYLVMYLAAKSHLLEQTIEHIANRQGLKVVHVCGFSKKCRCDYFLKATGPGDLLNLIYYSEFVVSASFHATLFSVLFEKQFCSLLPEAGTNTRIEDFLSYFGLSGRIVHTVDEIKNLDNQIDFTLTKSIREELVAKSKEQLLSAIVQK
ncbi:MAG: polysaccharide pyruvyl transferase family protein [Bacteroidales bacterium]|nr:polysaccharide pyruvyl transferase family protein [Bacteroidales bacterium]